MLLIANAINYDATDERAKLHYRRQFRRRIQVSVLLILVGVMIPLGDWLMVQVYCGGWRPHLPLVVAALQELLNFDDRGLAGVLGAMAGGMTAIFAVSSSFSWLAGALLLVAAVLMAGQALGYAAGGLPIAGCLSRLAAPLTTSRSALARFGLGAILGFATQRYGKPRTA